MRTIYRFLVTIIVVLTLSIAAVTAQSYSIPKSEEDLTIMSDTDLWDRGNTAYANDNFVDAERYYNEILSRDLYSTELYYNLGNVHHKRGELALSLLYYYKALKISPSDKDVIHNIEIAEAMTKDNIERIPTLFIVDWSRQIGAAMGCQGWSVTSLLTLALLLASLLVYLLAESLKLRRVGFWCSVLTALLFVISTRYAIDARGEILNPSEAIVMSRSMSVKSSPSESSTELFILHEGTKVRIKTELEQWSEVVIDDGKSGWVERRRIEQI